MGMPGARRQSPPGFSPPQLATLIKQVPEGDEWIHEIKFDGYRIIALIQDGAARLLTRRGLDWTGKFPSIANAILLLPVSTAVVDGEAVMLDKNGVSNFQALQNSLRERAEHELTYFLFDLTYCNGYDLRNVPLLKRKDLLRHLLNEAGQDTPLRFSDHVQGRGREFFALACRRRLEGVVSKLAVSPYLSKRSRSWVKTKCIQRQEFVLGGYSDPAGSRIGFGSLLLGYYDPRGNLIYCGRVGTGFSAGTLRDLYKELKKREQPAPSFANPPRGADARGVHWIRPELVAEVEFTERTFEGILRHPSFQGLREDKPAGSVKWEEPLDSDTIKMTKASSTRGHARAVRLTHPDKVLFPEQGVTKGALAQYYESIAENILPYVVHRPLMLLRCPDGRHKECFFQKHLTGTAPQALHGIRVKEKKKEAVYPAIEDVQGLISLVQLGTLEIHVWGSNEDHLEQPDRMVFDLDPDIGLPWDLIVKSAVQLKELLEDFELTSFVKTSGGKGLHVVVPLRPHLIWEEVKTFSHGVATLLAGFEPERYTTAMSKSRRRGKIFIDYLRNTRGATWIAPYSTRARSGAPVSAPLSWKELMENSRLRPDFYSMENLTARLEQSGDPWSEFFKVRQSITRKILKKLVRM
ncbi:MAG: DNA ligase D [Acidobacteria bacterium]|nr:DNA ligase D [Acidobacteriota bacterium]